MKLKIPYRIICFLALSLLIAACSKKDGPALPSPTPQTTTGTYDGPVKIGNPYRVNGITYYPREDLYYDVTGKASWYGPDFHGKRTANGEVYDMNEMTAAHTTLPMPTWVRVTNLENGRSVVLRVNDRGPFLKSRVIDVSRRAAQLLGFHGQGTADVRVQVVNADGSPVERPVDGGLTPLPQVTAENDIEQESLGDLSASAGNPGIDDPLLEEWTEEYFIQVGAYSSKENAESLVGRLRAVAPAFIEPVAFGADFVYRVRLGAFNGLGEAEQVLAAVQNLGFLDARIFTQRAQ